MSYAGHLRDDALAIFLFHGVVVANTSEVRNYTRKHLERDAFAGVLAELRRHGTAISMDQVAALRMAGEPYPPRAFAVTFDDGFENNLSVAAPVLADLDIPATIYITTDFVDSNRMSWIDRIEWAFDEVASVTVRLPWAEDPATASDADGKRALLDEVRAHVKTDPGLDGDALASDLQRQCGLPETWAGDEPLDRKLTWDQVRQLAADDRFIVGGHSHRHAVLSFLEPPALADELDTSLGLLEARAGVRCTHYSYPEGLAHCYSDGVIDALKARGVVCCPTAEAGVNGPDVDLFHLRRITVT